MTQVSPHPFWSSLLSRFFSWSASSTTNEITVFETWDCEAVSGISSDTNPGLLIPFSDSVCSSSFGFTSITMAGDASKSAASLWKTSQIFNQFYSQRSSISSPTFCGTYSCIPMKVCIQEFNKVKKYLKIKLHDKAMLDVFMTASILLENH